MLNLTVTHKGGGKEVSVFEVTRLGLLKNHGTVSPDRGFPMKQSLDELEVDFQSHEETSMRI